MKLKTQTDESIIHVQEQTGEMQRHRKRLYRKLVYFHRPVYVLFVSVVMQTTGLKGNIFRGKEQIDLSVLAVINYKIKL